MLRLHPRPAGLPLSLRARNPSTLARHDSETRSQRQGDLGTQRHDQAAHGHHQGASSLYPRKTSGNEDVVEPTKLAQRPRTCAHAAATRKPAPGRKSQECSQSGAYTMIKSFCCCSTWHTWRGWYASATNARGSRGGGQDPAPPAALERGREQTAPPSQAKSGRAAGRVESL